MINQVICPSCGIPFEAPQGTGSPSVRCPECQAPVAIEAAPLDVLPADDTDAGLQFSPKPLPPKPKSVAPKRGGPPPAPKPRTSSILPIVLAILALLGGMAVLGCGGIVLVGWYLWSAGQPAAAKRPAAFADARPPAGAVKPAPREDMPIPLPPDIPQPLEPIQPPDRFPAVPQLPAPPDNPPPPPPPPDVAFGPPRHVFALQTAPFTGERRIVNLPSTVSDLAVGGGGRFVILRLGGENKLAVFDVNAATIVKHIPVAADARFAAGMDRLMIAVPSAGVLERWDLHTVQREAAMPLPVPSAGALCMGSASNGPLLIEPPTDRRGQPLGGDTTFVDPGTGKVIPYAIESKARGPAQFNGRNVRASADGTVFAARGDWNGATSLVLRGGRGTVCATEETATHMACPSPDGRLVFTDTAVCSAEGVLLHKPNNPGNFITSPFLPAAQGPFYLHLVDLESRNLFNPAGERGIGIDLEFYLPGQYGTPAAVWKSFDGVPGSKLYTVAAGLTADKRFLLVARAKVLITVPESGDKLVLDRFDPEAQLAKGGKDFLFVASDPPPAAARGTRFSYTPEIKSNRGGVKLRLDSGPAGMTAADGKLTWDVPAAFAEKEVGVLLTASDASGKDVFHSFRLPVVDRNAVPQVVPPDALPAGAEKPAAEPVAPPKPLPRPGVFPLYRPKEDREDVALSGTARDVEVGGGGRFLVLHLKDRRKLAIFDLGQGKVVKEIPLADDVIRYAAGAHQVVVLYPNVQMIHFWSLTTFERESQAPFPRSLKNDEIHQVCMGSASAGPLFIYLPKEKRTLALDLGSVSTTEVRWTHWSPSNAYGPLHMRVSPDGSVLLGWDGGWAGMEMATFRGGRQTGSSTKFEFSSGLFALPSADARFVFTPWAIVSRDYTAAKVPELKDAYLVPAREPGYFLALHHGRGELPHPPRKEESAVSMPAVREAVLYSDGRRKLFTLEGWDEVKSGGDLYWEKRIHYFPTGGLLATLGPRNDRVVLRKIDLAAELDRSGTDYLFVASQAPPARPGKEYRYAVDVRSKKGGVKVKLDASPAGLSVSPAGQLTWAVPANFGEPEVEVRLTVADASGQEVFHNFSIPVTGP